VHPWVAVVAIRIMPIKKSTRNARWARSLGKRILKIYSGAVLRGGSQPAVPRPRSEYISTGAGQYSARSRWEIWTCHNAVLASSCLPPCCPRCVSESLGRPGVGQPLGL